MMLLSHRLAIATVALLQVMPEHFKMEGRMSNPQTVRLVTKQKPGGSTRFNSV